jgi:hypothetical protein
VSYLWYIGSNVSQDYGYCQYVSIHLGLFEGKFIHFHQLFVTMLMIPHLKQSKGDFSAFCFYFGLINHYLMLNIFGLVYFVSFSYDVTVCIYLLDFPKTGSCSKIFFYFLSTTTNEYVNICIKMQIFVAILASSRAKIETKSVLTVKANYEPLHSDVR